MFVLGAEWNVSGSRLTCMHVGVAGERPEAGALRERRGISGGGTGSAWNETGRSARSLANMPSRSGRIHCSISPSLMSSSASVVVGAGTVCVTLEPSGPVINER